VGTYFTRLAQTSTNKHFSTDALIVANNGWIWNADPLVDFASPRSRAYFLREVIVWGDCVKLRYGQSEVLSIFKLLYFRMIRRGCGSI
jgi:glycogen debranching enzyme